MKAINTQATITSIRARVDKSIGLSINTPELTKEEVAMFFELQGRNINLLIEPEDGDIESHEITKTMDTKTPSQRLRSVLYVLFSQSNSDEPFDIFYSNYMETIITKIKARLE